MPAAALVIAAENLLSALRERVSVEGDVLTFADTEPIQALQVIIEERPNLPAGIEASGAAALVRKQDFGPALLRRLWRTHGRQRT